MQKLTLKAAGLFTYPNPLSSVPNGSLAQADNVVIDREGVLEPRRGFNQLPGVLGSLSTNRGNQIFRFGDNVLSHYGALNSPTKIAFYAPTITETGRLNSGSNIYSDLTSVVGLYVGQYLTVLTVEQNFVGNITLGSNQITSVSSTKGLYVGQLIGGIGIPANTTLSSISGTGPYALTISANATFTKLTGAYVASNANILGFVPNTTITVVGTTSVTLSNNSSVTSRAQTFAPAAVNTATDFITITNHGFLDGQSIEFTSTGTLPTGLTSGVEYFVINSTDNAFQVALVAGAQVVDLTTQGTGTHTVIQRPSINFYGWIDYAGTYLKPDSITKLRSVEANNNVYFTTSTGVQKLDSLTDSIVLAGVAKGLDGSATLNPSSSGFMIDNTQVAYRIVWGYTDANQNLLLGAPSQRIIISNNTGSTKDVDLNVTVPQGLGTNYFYQAYRSGFSADANSEPNDELALVYEAPLTSTDISNGFVTFTDQTPESLRTGATIYTAPSQEGILQANTPPPFAKDLCLFKGSTFYANTQTKQSLTLTMLAVSSQFTIFGDITSVAGDTPTTVRSVDYSITGNVTTGSSTISNVNDVTSLSPGQSIVDATNPSFFPDGTVITDIVSSNTITVSNPSSGTSVGDAFSVVITGIFVGQQVSGTGIPANTTITNIYTPIQLSGNVTNGSPIVTNILSTAGLAVGQPVTGGGIPTNTVIQSIDSDTQVTLSKNVNLTFTGNVAVGFPTITAASNTSFLVVNQIVTDQTHPTYFPVGTTIISISGTTITMSANATNTATGDTFLAAATISPFSATGDLVSGTNTVSNIVISGTSKLATGQVVSDNTNQSALPSGTTITSVLNPTTVQLSDNSTISSTGDTFTIAPTLPPLTFGGGFQISNGATSTLTQTNLTLKNGSGGVQLNDIIVIDGTTFTAKLVENIPAKQFKIYSQGTPAQNISDTAQSLIRVMNRTTGPTPLTYAYYLSGFQSLPGQIQFEERVFGGGTFYATAGSTSQGAAYSPNLPGPGGTSVPSKNDAFGNGLYYSKTNQPEAVPLLNFTRVGSAHAAILRVIPLRDSLFVLKEDGVYRLTGEGPTSFRVDLFDSTTQILSAESAVSLNNLIFMLTKYGIVTVSDTGVTVISRAIEDKMLALFETNFTSAKNFSFGISYESDRKYIFFCVTNPEDQYPTQAYVYNTFTNTWTRWILSQTCGVIQPKDDLLYLGDVNSNTFDIERKTRTYTDYTDSSFIVNLLSVIGVTSTGSQAITGVASTTYFNVGQTILGTGIPEGSQIIDLTASTITINKPATSNGTTTILLDDGKTIILDDISDVEVGDVVYQASGRYSIITALSTLNGTVTTRDFIDNWVVGPTTILKAAESVVKYVPQTAGNPGSMKQFREAALLFQVPFFNQVTIGFDTDLSSGTQSVPLNGLYGFQWGRFKWGQIPWGGTTKPLPIRTYVPQQKQRCSLLNVTVTHREAYSFYRLNGISFIHNNLSERVGV